MFSINPTTLNMYLTRGDDASFEVKIKDGTFQSGDAVNFSVRKDVNSPTKEIDITVTTFTAQGAAVVSITHNHTKDLKFGDYVYDIQLVRNGAYMTIIPVKTPDGKKRILTIGEEVSY